MSFLFCFALCASFGIISNAEGSLTAFGTFGEDNNLTWKLYSDGELVIDGTGNMGTYGIGEVNATPWYLHNGDIVRVTIHEGVTNVGAYAFCDCTELVSVSLPWGLAEIKSCFLQMQCPQRGNNSSQCDEHRGMGI